MEVVSKPCQDRFLHPSLVHYRKNKKIQVAKWGTPKKYLKKKHILIYFTSSSSSDQQNKFFLSLLHPVAFLTKMIQARKKLF
jgi:hypothetical protein